MSKVKSNLIIGLDFDGTAVMHKYPDIGEPVPHCIETLKKYQERGWKIVLNTMRSDNRMVPDGNNSKLRHTLTEAVDYLQNNGINLYGVNENPAQKYWTSSPKVYAHVYIDDAALGCPLIIPKKVFEADPEERPYVDWLAVDKLMDMMYSSGITKSH